MFCGAPEAGDTREWCHCGVKPLPTLQGDPASLDWQGWQGDTHQRDSDMGGLVTSGWGTVSSQWHEQACDEWIWKWQASFNRELRAALDALGQLCPKLLPSWVIAEHQSPNPLHFSKLLSSLGFTMLKSSCMKEYFPFVNRLSDLLSIDPVRQGFKFNLFPSYL